MGTIIESETRSQTNSLVISIMRNKIYPDTRSEKKNKRKNSLVRSIMRNTIYIPTLFLKVRFIIANVFRNLFGKNPLSESHYGKYNIFRHSF